MLTSKDKPFFPGGLSPDSSYSDPKSRSALSPGSGRSPYPMNRSTTSPLPQTHVTSPEELSANSDSAFPRFPTARSATSPSARPKTRDRLEPSPSYDQNYAQPSPLFAPLSPRINGGESIMRRMDTIAPGPFTGDRRPSTSSGPFSGDRRPSTSNGPPSPSQSRKPLGHQRTNTQGSVRSNGITANLRLSTTSSASRGSMFSNGSFGLPSRPKFGAGPFATMPPPPPPPPKDEESEGIDAFLARLQNETLKPAKLDQDSRSKTFPMRQESRDDVPSARPTDRMPPPRRPTDIDTRNDYTLSSRNYDPLLSRPMDRKDDLSRLPPVPNYARDFPSDAVHTPSDSGLSEDSYTSSGFRSVASSRSSPPISEASHSRQASKVGRLEYLDDEPVRRVQSSEMFLDPRPAPPHPDSRRGKSPEPRLQPPNAPYIGAPDSPIDPAIQKGLYSTTRREEPRQIRDPALNTPGFMNPSPRNLEPEPYREVNRRPTTAGKGRCRGCSEQIIGKSIKDSSGRLTGRYHKACFVCRTCRDPFPTAEFYVFNNAPYCEQHYHQLNGSLCRTCNRGIEGQYLETDQRLKFHPRCFCCSTCRIVLREEFYEVGGRNYCERHAYSAMNQRNNYLGPGGNMRTQKLEKRRTRLMMMS